MSSLQIGWMGAVSTAVAPYAPLSEDTTNTFFHAQVALGCSFAFATIAKCAKIREQAKKIDSLKKTIWIYLRDAALLQLGIIWIKDSLYSKVGTWLAPPILLFIISCLATVHGKVEPLLKIYTNLLIA